MPKKQTTAVAKKEATTPDFSDFSGVLEDAQSRLEITDIICEEDVGRAAKSLTSLKEVLAAVEDRRKMFTAPLNKVIRQINSEAKPLKDKLDTFIAHETKLLRAYEAEKVRAAEKERAKEMKALKRKGATQMQEALQREIVHENKVQADGLQTRKRRTFEVTDIKKLCGAIAAGTVEAGAISVHRSYLNALAKVTNGEGKIPGVRFIDVTDFARTK